MDQSGRFEVAGCQHFKVGQNGDVGTIKNTTIILSTYRINRYSLSESGYHVWAGAILQENIQQGDCLGR